jgi:hypothetical protein
MLALDVHSHFVPDIFRRFALLIGDQHWRKRVHACKQEMKGNVFLRSYLMRENDIAFQLDRLSELMDQFGTIPAAEADNPAITPAAVLATQALSIMEDATKDDAEQFRRRIHGALKNPTDMRGLQLELTAATHFARRGSQISWPKTTGKGIFDLLVESDAHDPLEVECKSIGEDKGRKIHRLEVIGFAGLLKPELSSTVTGLNKGISVVMTVPDRLPSAHKERVALAKALARAIFAGNDCDLADGSVIRISDFHVSQLGNVPRLDPRDVRAAVDAISGTDNRSTVIIGTRAGGVLALTVQSRRDDAFLTSVFDTFSDAARRQLTASRAGMLWAGFDGLDGAQLLSIAERDQDSSQQPTALRVAVSDFLSSSSRDHIIGVGFTSRGAHRPAQDGVTEMGGTAYYFPKRKSPFWCDGFGGMFNWSGSRAT